MSERRMVALSWAASIVFLYAITAGGSINQYFSTRQANLIAAADAGVGPGASQAMAGVISGAIAALPLVALLAWTPLFMRRGPRPARVTIWWFALLAMNVVVNNPISRSRYWFLTVTIGLLFTLPGMTKSRFRAIILVGVAAAAIIFPYSDVFRVESQYERPISSGSLQETLAIKDYDQLTMTGNGIWWVDETGLHFGRQLASAALFFVPRSIWPDKAYDTGVEIGIALKSVNVNLSSPIWLELWVDFWWPGVVAGLIIAGGLARRFDLRYTEVLLRPDTSLAVLRIGLPLIAGYEFILIRGPLLQAMGRVAFLVLALWFITERSTSRADPSSDITATSQELVSHGPRKEPF
ncbi:hypothetical protein [Pseudonocardia oroxyli]|uniref:hypothetical protein n=1 Tax=Pseudonocardia oroxyli TaxID=366584 RepID=UPI00115FF507|nr:hypothetical protein [Pseudonocardia oroxyli]